MILVLKGLSTNLEFLARVIGLILAIRQLGRRTVNVEHIQQIA